MIIIILFLIYIYLSYSEVFRGGAVYTYDDNLNDSSLHEEIRFILDDSNPYEIIYKSNLLTQISDISNIENEIKDLADEENIDIETAKKNIYLEKYRPLVELKLSDDAVEISYIRSKDQWNLDRLLSEIEKFAREKGIKKLKLIDDAYFEEFGGCKYKAAIFRLFFTDAPSEQVTIYAKKGFVMDSECSEKFKKAYETIKEENLSRFINEKLLKDNSTKEFYEKYKNEKIKNLPKTKDGPCILRKELIGNIVTKRDPLINEILECIDSDSHFMIKYIKNPRLS